MTSAWVFLNLADPMVAWLTYRGEMKSVDQILVKDASLLSIWHTGRLRSALHNPDDYNTELAIEASRALNWPDKPSRLRGFYVFEDEATARRASRRWGWHRRPELRLTEIELAEECRMSRFDSDWITEELPGGPGEWIHHYLAGEPRADEPIWETVVEGRARIPDDALRADAKAVVHSIWPRSAPLLEISRLAARLGSDLGQIAAFVQADHEGLRINFALNMQDATNPSFLGRVPELLNDDSCDIDRAAMQPRSPEEWFAAPDLTSQIVWLARPHAT